ncbi:MAG: hypothetical protein MJ071_02310 [Oscillospiraceae bacterium]|nr:hypothetical protein [Oscillospiraceae bacterium]
MNQLKWPFGFAGVLSADNSGAAAEWADEYAKKMIAKIQNAYLQIEKDAQLKPTDLKKKGTLEIARYFLELTNLIQPKQPTVKWDDERLIILLRGTRKEVEQSKLYDPYIQLMAKIDGAITQCAEEMKNHHLSSVTGTSDLIQHLSKKQGCGDLILLIQFNSHYVDEYFDNHKINNNSLHFKNALKKTYQEPLKMIFDYEDWIKPYRSTILEHISVVKCPYCDRNYIANAHDEDGGISTTADLDHYHIKSLFPMFALSLFNLIPACNTCNSKFKGAKQTRTTYPYEIGFQNHAQFYTEASLLEKIKLMQGRTDANFMIKLKTADGVSQEKQRMIQGDCDVFQLERVYALHKNLVRDLYWRSIIYYSNDYIAAAKKLLNDNQIDKDLYWFLYGYDESDDGQDHENTLSKLRRDIIQEIEELYTEMDIQLGDEKE